MIRFGSAKIQISLVSLDHMDLEHTYQLVDKNQMRVNLWG